MRITFRVRFHTHPGQSLWLTGEHEVFGAGNLERAIPLRYLNAEFWETTIVFPRNDAPVATYNYVLKQPDGSAIYDWGTDKGLPVSVTAEDILIVDAWNPAGLFENAFYTEPFKEVLLKCNQRGPSSSEAHYALETPSKPVQGVSSPSSRTHTFKIKAPLLTSMQTLCLVGDTADLRNWDTRNPILLTRTA